MKHRILPVVLAVACLIGMVGCSMLGLQSTATISSTQPSSASAAASAAAATQPVMPGSTLTQAQADQFTTQINNFRAILADANEATIVLYDTGVLNAQDYKIAVSLYNAGTLAAQTAATMVAQGQSPNLITVALGGVQGYAQQIGQAQTTARRRHSSAATTQAS